MQDNISRTRTTLATALVACGVLFGGSRSDAASKPDTTQAFLKVVIDTPEQFRAQGTWTSIDRTVPPNGFEDVSLSPTGFPTYVIPKSANWLFRIGATINTWRDPFHPKEENGATGYFPRIDGFHLNGPHHTGSIQDKDPDTLKVVTANGNPSSNIDFFARKKTILTAMAVWPHPTTFPGIKHYDHYGLKQIATAMKGPSHSVCGPTEVAARHTTSSKDVTLFGPTLGSSSAAGSHASYDAPSGTLTVHPGAMDIFRAGGSTTPGIDPPFSGDPILNASLGEIVLHFVGPTGDGGYLFSGTETSLSDPEGQLQMIGHFSEYRIYDSSLTGTIDSYALYDSLTTADIGGSCESAFLGSFVDNNITGDTVPGAVWLQIQGTCVTFSTSANMAVITSGFTTSVGSIPATVVVAAGKMYP